MTLARAHNRDTVPLTSYISLYNEPLFSGHLYYADAAIKINCIWLISIVKNLY